MNAVRKKLIGRATNKVALFLFFVVLSLSLNATNFIVNTTADTHAANPAASPNDAGGNISFRSAMEHVDAIGGTHTITVPAGTYVLTLGKIIFGTSSNRNVSIQGAGAASTIIDGNNNDRIIITNTSGLLDNIVLSADGVTFRNGNLSSDTFGGGAICVGGGLGNITTFTNCIFQNNTVPATRGTGGAINAVISGDLNIDNCTFTNNHDNDADGGAIYYILYQGGGIYPAFTGAVHIQNSTFTSNTTVTNGGAIAVSSQGSPIAGQTFSVNIHNNTFTGNTATGYGGALSVNNSFNTPVASFKVNYNRIVNNTSTLSATTSGLHFVNSAGSVNAKDNWWGCNTGPTAAGTCDKAAGIGAPAGGTLDVSTWIQLQTTANPNPICNTPAGLGNTSLVTATFLKNSANASLTLANISRLIGLPVTWSATLGSLSGQELTIQADGEATATFTSNGTGGTAAVQAKVDNIPNGDDVSTADIVVNTKPTVTTPANQVKCEGSTTTFTSTITGTPAPTITWYKGATPLVNGVQGTGSSLSGQGTNTITFTNTQLGDAGTYHVEASNDCGLTSSSNFTLTVEPLPDISAVPVASIVCNKGTITINITQPNGVGGTYNRTTSVLPAGVSHTAANTQNGIAYGPAFTDVVTNTTAIQQIISYTFTPIGGPTLNCPGTPVTVNITVEPNPTITCPGPATVNVDPGTCTAVVNGIAPASSTCPANCGPCTITYTTTGATTLSGNNDVSGQTFNKGTTMVTYTIIDANTNSTTCSFNVIVNDNIAPTVTCPGDQTLSNTPGLCSATFIINDPITDNCPGSTWSASFSGNPNGNPSNIGPIADGTNSGAITFQKGSTMVTITGVDASGNPAGTCTFIVTVNDTEAPVFTCPPNSTQSTDPGVCTFTTAVTPGPVTDNCPGGTWSASYSGNPNGNPAGFGPIPIGLAGPGVTFQKGTTTITYTAVDASGNPATPCIWTITVNDNQVPVLVCPANQNLVAGAGVCTADYTINDPVTDNCAGATWSVSFSGNAIGNPANFGPIADGSNGPSRTFNKGVTTVTVSATDANGNNAVQCTFTVTVTDTQNPTVSCPGNQTINTTPGLCTGVYTIPGALLDNCPGGTWTATFSGNPNGNPAPVTTPAGSNATVTFNKGTTTVTITGQDASGNNADVPCTFTVTVNDNQAPVLTCPANQALSTSPGLCTADYTVPDPISDNCPGSTWSASFSGNPNGNPANFGPVADGSNGPSRTFEKGTTTVTITGVDANGNNAVQCTFTVTVTDNQPPTIGCPGPATLNTDPGTCTTSVGFLDPITDNCPGATWSVSFSGNPNGNPAGFGPINDGSNGPFRTFQKGTTTVTITAVDASGNNAAPCTYTITVVDNQLPVVTCPANQVLSTAPGSCTGTYSIPDPVSDNCPGSTWSATFSGNPNGNPAPAGPFADGTNSPLISFEKGVTTVTLSAVDASGNNAITCTFTVTFNDVTPPTLACPANVVLNAAAGVCTATYTINDPITDNCAGSTWNATFSGNPNGNPAATGSINDGNNSAAITFQKGTTTVTINGVDAAGNPAAPCTFTVTVNDNQPPVITCPGNQTFNTNNAGCTYLQSTNAFNATATDNCPGVTLQYTLTGATTGTGSTLNGVTFNVGLTTVNWLATDASGNTAGCMFTVTINQTSGIILTAGNNPICAGQNGGVLVNLTGTAPFNGSFNILNNTTNTSTTYNWTSNLVGGPQNIVIPAASVPNTTNTPITYTFTWISMVDANGCVAITQGSENMTVNPLPAITVTRNPNSGTVCPGSTITYTVAAAPGNTVPATFNYTITEAGNPTPLQQGSNLPYGNVIFTTPSCPYNKVITFTATPFASQSPNCMGSAVTNTVTVQDLVAPTLTGSLPGGNLGNTCLANVPAAPSAATIRAQYSDNCTPQNSLTVSAPVTGGTPVGGSSCNWTRTYTYTVSDGCGNNITAVVTYSGNDTEAPTWTTAAGSLNRTVQYCDINGVNGLNAANALAPVATDNCTPAGSLVVVKQAGIFAQGACPTQGIITNTFFVADACGNTSVAYTQTITVIDNQGPVISGASSQVLNISGANCSANLPNYITSLPVTATDCAAPGGIFPAPTAITYNNNNTGNNLIWQSPAPGTQIFGSGGQIVPVTITAMDACGNSSTVTINVSLQDLTPPTARCHNITVNLSSAVNAGSVTVTPSQVDGSGAPLVLSSDNCGPVTLSFLPGNTSSVTYTCANVGVNNVTLNVTDAGGNQASCNATITVVDNTRPTFSCPGAQTVSKNANCVSTLPDFVTSLGLTATDNCTPSGSIVWTQTPAAGTIFGAGVTTTTVTLTATDGNGNVSSPACNITVNFVDNVPPQISCPATVNATTGAGNTDCSVNVTYTLPTATDNCQGPGFPGAVPVTLVSGPASGSQFFVGTTVVTYRATDAAGNSATCSFNVVVTDNTAPTIVCQSNKTVSANSAGCVYVHNNNSSNWNPTIFDNCLLAVTPFTYMLSGATTGGPFTSLDGLSFNLGTTTVTATVKDASNNVSAPCTFTVTVLDNAVPAFTVCPANMTVTTAAPNGLSGCRANVTLAQPTMVQNCTTTVEWFITSVTSGTPNSSGIGTIPTSYPMNVGITQVQYRLSDANGNSTTCTYTVTVNNAVAGTITGTAAAAQNAATTSTITFTGSGGTANYCFTYDVSVNGGPFGAPQTICTTGGQNSVTVAQSNAVIGTYQYRLTAVTDASGCNGTITNPNTATITVVNGTPDLTSSQFFSTTQISAGGTIDEVIVLRNVGTAPTSGQIVINVTSYSPLTGLTVTQLPGGTNVTIGIDTYTISGGWTFNAATGQLTSNNAIPAGGSNTIGLRITRGTGGSAGANGSVTQTTTVSAGTGGGETPSTNNTISNSILKN